MNGILVMELRYKSAARVDLQAFIDHYEEAFRELYRDTGLWNESSIVSGYQKNAALLYSRIADAIDEHLVEAKVLGRKHLARNWYEIDFYVGSRLVVVYYSEDLQRDVRWIESISINRKPIIF